MNVLDRDSDVLLCIWLCVIDLKVEIDNIWVDLRLLSLFPRHHFTKFTSFGIWHAQNSWSVLLELSSTNALRMATAELSTID